MSLKGLEYVPKLSDEKDKSRRWGDYSCCNSSVEHASPALQRLKHQVAEAEAEAALKPITKTSSFYWQSKLSFARAPSRIQNLVCPKNLKTGGDSKIFRTYFPKKRWVSHKMVVVVNFDVTDKYQYPGIAS